MNTRTDTSNNQIITLEWLELETKQHNEPYFVVQGFYSKIDELRKKESPNLETILNFMYQKGYTLVSTRTVGTSNLVEIVFMQQ